MTTRARRLLILLVLIPLISLGLLCIAGELSGARMVTRAIAAADPHAQSIEPGRGCMPADDAIAQHFVRGARYTIIERGPVMDRTRRFLAANGSPIEPEPERIILAFDGRYLRVDAVERAEVCRGVIVRGRSIERLLDAIEGRAI